MPYVQRKRKFSGKRRVYTRKRTYSRRYSRRKSAKYAGMSLMAPLTPPYRTTMLTYYETDIALNPATGGTAQYVFRGNGCYDPDASGSGKQPFNFDQWTDLYQKWVVLWSKITITATSRDSNRQFTLTVIPSKANSLTGTPDQAPEMPGNRSKIFTGFSGSRSLGVVTNQRKTKTVLGYSNPLDIEGCFGTASADPASDYAWYWIVVIQGNDSGFDPAQIDISVKIQYIVRFTERANKGSS